MNQKVIAFNKSLKKNKLPTLRVGDIVRVHRQIKEGDKERIQIFKGLIIAIKGKQSSSPTITVRRESSGVGVEMIFPIYLPTIEKIEILRHSKVRRAKLYYMRQRTGRATKMKALELSEKELAFMKEIDTELKEKKGKTKHKKSTDKAEAKSK